MAPPASKRLIGFGFTLVLALMTLLTLVGLLRMKDIYRHLETTANVHNVKAGLASAMRTAARERAVSLYTMSLMDEPFERDAEFLRFNTLATKFTRARQQLLAMPISEEELRLLERQAALARINQPLQNEVADLIIESNPSAKHILLTRVMPIQNKVLAELDEMVAMQQRKSIQGFQAAAHAYRAAQVSIIVLGSLAMGLGILIARLVTRRVTEAEDALFQEKELAEVTLHSIGDAVITTNAQGYIGFMNPVAEEMTGWSLSEARGEQLGKILQLFNSSTLEQMEHPLSLLPTKDASEQQHTLLLRRDGREYAVAHSWAPIRNRTGRLMGAVVVFHDVTTARQLAQQLSWQACHDALTGLANRHQFEERMAQLLDSARAQGKMHVLLYIDLDQFKIVNDTCGHMAGDELLRQIALLMQNHTRSTDLVARLGGDEFALLLKDCDQIQGERIAETLRRDIADWRFVWEDRSFSVGASMGLVPIRPDTPSLTALLSAADAACYAAKDNGRNRVHSFRPDDGELARRHGEMQWVFRIQQAIEENRLTLYCQTILPALPAASEPRHIEILLRMRDEQGELIPPMAFIPSAERYHLMPALDRWVIQHTLDWLANRSSAERNTFQRCFINISGQSLCEPGFLNFVTQAIQASKVQPERVCFEITETSAIANLSQARQFMHELKALGCHFSLDDFGSGMSSFGYLKNLPVDYLKIDGAFVRDMTDDPVDQAMVEAINRIGQVLGIQTIAEFVENDAIRGAVSAIGVDFVQGFGLHRPSALDSFALEIQPHDHADLIAHAQISRRSMK
ncbi:EAL domain-containing protein [Thermithiobacillus plumbiphilus]|uniref:EAL domain-containing protein n=1 Tax=Thermithiobacillus plumbiphilus TaxID=1729899 RepID=A0ABU9D7U3_9PROT